MEYKLYAKASPDGRSLGDCPFTQRANLGLKIKGIANVTLILIDLDNKPTWYKDINTSVPTLEYDGKFITDSYQILQYLDETYPDPPLNPPNNKEAEEVTGKIFSVFAAWIKNQDSSKDDELRDAFTAELVKINEYLGKHSWSLLCSDQWSLADCALVPRLYHIQIVTEDFKGYNPFKDYYNLQKYAEFTFNTEVFKATDYPREYVIHGWEKHRK